MGKDEEYGGKDEEYGGEVLFLLKLLGLRPNLHVPGLCHIYYCYPSL